MQVGKLCQVSARVEKSMLASSIGSGDVDVCATPAMIALMERAALQCASEYLKDGETTVGAQMEVAHISAVPAGAEVTATAEIIKSEGKKVLFKVFCEDANGIIGKGTHLRLVVNRDRFEERAMNKRAR
ncbi:MAG: thioesterase family protein [Provencibacterium sp.]|jgi:fluoroacetyl-CoA thioesterase|nr:thioesterase family protein [Provencibacterium sp.]